MLYCEFGPDGVGFFAERDAGARVLAGDLVVRILLGRAFPEGASSERAVLHYAAYERRTSFRDAPSAEVPLADAGRTIGELIGSGFHWGYVAIEGCRCEIMLSPFDGLVSLFWPTPDAWSIGQWEALTLGILDQARDAGAKLSTNLDNHTLSERTKSGNVGPLLAALWATLVAAYLYFGSTYDLSVVYLASDTSQLELLKNRVIAYAKVVSVTGSGSAFGLTIPIFLALLPLALRKHRRAALVVAGVLTLGVCLIWPFSIGVLYLPTAALLLLDAGRSNAGPAHAT